MTGRIWSKEGVCKRKENMKGRSFECKDKGERMKFVKEKNRVKGLTL
jgi:hypothetical protein